MSLMCEMMGTGSSSASKGMRKDAAQRDLIKKRENKRKDTSDVNEFMKVMAEICPEYYGDN